MRIFVHRTPSPFKGLTGGANNDVGRKRAASPSQSVSMVIPSERVCSPIDFSGTVVIVCAKAKVPVIETKGVEIMRLAQSCRMREIEEERRIDAEKDEEAVLGIIKIAKHLGVKVDSSL